MHIDLYQKYMDIALKVNLFYYGITGAILSFYFTNNGNGSLIEYSFIMPIVFSIGLIALFIFGWLALAVSMEDIDLIVEELGMSRFVRIDGLIYIFKGSAAFMFLSSLGLLYILFSDSL